ncbi:hypothetical protein EF888_00140 [Silicimonas algicola]|uniref:Secreted protein n=1 Tax=Silicimonas algicola TaxID=1826607 RepID=A0A316G6N5_9RHOB|nr:hypothetical protein [Silicimonas algicola]AZQ65678.1 hypothetical protein EF888_00140 [Silicimonas algicola]PWK56619.1 hypothetical protein C8D95_104292 [Silicimonas algicola]
MRRLLPLAFLPAAAFADDAVIEGATAARTGGTWTFEVTLSHGDTGWDDYADGWRIVTGDGIELGTRVLLHPHVDEQPFTRSLSGVTIPDGLATVYVEARTTREGWGEARHPVALK